MNLVMNYEDFVYESVYKRHLVSRSHQQYVENLLFLDSYCAPDVEAVPQVVLNASQTITVFELYVLILHFQNPDIAFDEQSSINVDPSSVDTSEEIYEDYETSEDLEACFEELNKTKNGNYYPFPSKVFALLFFLVNSPHPMVSLLAHITTASSLIYPQGEKNLSLVWFVLKQLGIHTPSLTSVKNFKLPAMEAPLRVTISTHCQLSRNSTLSNATHK